MLAITMIAINCVITESLESFPILFKMNSKSHVYFISVLPAFTLLGGDNNYVRPYLRAKAQISYAIVYKRRWQYILCKPPSYPIWAIGSTSKGRGAGAWEGEFVKV